MDKEFVKNYTPQENAIIQCIESYLLAWYDDIDETWHINADDCAEGILLDLQYNGWDIINKETK